VTARTFELHLGDPGYPAHLAATPRPPKTLYGIGDPSALVPGLAIVGSRKATPYGLAVARVFAGYAASNGVAVISGAAVGCDMTAQLAALEAGGRTVAVLGCGADVDYPSRASTLLSRLRGGEGAVVSELAWGTPSVRGHFPARNRIIAGLSAAVLIVEAALPSGTFSTADHAIDAGRDVLAVPGSVFFAGSAGCNRLLRQGCFVVGCVEDLADSLADLGLIDPVSAAHADARFGTLATDSDDDEVLRALLADPMAPDAVALALGLTGADTLRRIARLEALGRLARYPDGRYGPCAQR
jgi:DNA processing protein